MFSLQSLRQSKAARNAAASYVAFASTAIGGLASIPIAVHYLSKAEMGLWSIIFTIVTYLLWLDLGIGNATGRKIADAIATGNKPEINRWWTLSMGVLLLLGGLMFLVALALTPFLGLFLEIPPQMANDAKWLFLGTAAVSMIGMPFRAYPGLLIAQEQFHWVPIVQALLPWLQLGPFWYLLHAGFGVRSYLPAIALAQMCGWAIWGWKVHSDNFSVRVDLRGWTRARFRELFAYSSSLAVSGIVESVMQSLPSLLLARLGGLSFVAVYNLSSRGPSLVSSLALRTTHSFYPNLQKLFVSKAYQRFMNKFRHVNQLGIWIGLAGAGAIIAGNRPLVSWLAKADFYAGAWTNLWLACWIINTTFVNGTLELFQISGRMGKTAFYSLLELPVGIALCATGYHYGGLPWLVASFAFLPLLVRGPYAIFAGPRFCGFSTRLLCGRSLVSLAGVLALAISGGAWCASGHETGKPFEIFGRTTYLPSPREWIFGAVAAGIGVFQAMRHLRAIRRH
ncbi:lipopolysaccharide biosynthesis protein [Luteolibacter sp. SL250]|uniref:lipopolysaccharide biosynthesis protein n=1 Tax=Luteolibacter sp. SL250 TaxID=2995170 RepID=UPI0022719044|nr:lipopolysaccharide biosynthesis protein [Luteolibacter sp. SL250]WAC20448.1 lipopolysaccharide biosynthesis protein [Luteolibacter sp. SL250]